MPKRVAYRGKSREPTFIKAWREFRDLSQERLVARLEEMGVEMSTAQLSRIENGEQPYHQDVLEAIADALQTHWVNLLIRDPRDPEAIWSIWDQAKPGERKMIVELAKTVVKTGT